MIQYHGGRHSTLDLAYAIWRNRHAMVSFADAPPAQFATAVLAAQTYTIDNGAFTVWRQGKPVDWSRFYGWVAVWTHPNLAWVLVPDVIDGSEEQNDALLGECPLPAHRQMPVWHLHESLGRLERLADAYGRVALGSSGQYSTPGTARWWGQIGRAMEILCDERGVPLVPFHCLRGLNTRLFPHIPCFSADSACVSRSIGTTNWGGAYADAPDTAKARVMLERLESFQAAARWAGIPQQEELFTELSA